MSERIAKPKFAALVAGSGRPGRLGTVALPKLFWRKGIEKKLWPLDAVAPFPPTPTPPTPPTPFAPFTPLPAFPTPPEL